MHFYTFAAASLALALAPGLSLAEPRPYLLRRATSDRILGLMERQEGYAPQYGPTCDGPGDTCQTSCGADYVQCPSTDDSIWCYRPAVAECCTDGSGLACDKDYYCTKDSNGGTWCCPDSLDLTACAALYTVTGLESIPYATQPATESPTHVGTTSHYTPTPTYAANSTVRTITTIPTFTGAANARTVGGFALPLALAGVLAAL